MKDNIRPWGRYDILDEGEGYKVKRIAVKPGARLSYQKHAKREEFWTIVAGRGRVTLDGLDAAVREGDRVVVEKRMKHRIQNTGKTPLVFIEVQRGSYLGEDDIVRFDDDYGRVS